MIKATKIFSYDCAHLLTGHKGLCQNLHGHTYRLEVTVQSRDENEVQAEGPSSGMVMDFKDLKDVVNCLIVNKFDHATLIDTTAEGFEAELLELLEKHNKKVVKLLYRPTAEKMAMTFLKTLNNFVVEANTHWYVEKVRLYETPTSFADAELMPEQRQSIIRILK